MAQIFPKWANRVPAMALVGALGVGLFGTGFVWYYFSPEFTDVGYRPEQPVPYSHKLHAGDLRIDCRFCHYSVERAAVASVPPTEVCMNCHKLVKRDAPTLAPILASSSSGARIRWVRVHKVPEYAYFDHSVHVGAGVGCSSCHGDIASMEVVKQVEPLSMGWCLECHRDPSGHLRPPEEITDTKWRPGPDQAEFAAAVMEERGMAPPEECSACHR